jgi:uncharacterized protein (TIGR03435 family)
MRRSAIRRLLGVSGVGGAALSTVLVLTNAVQSRAQSAAVPAPQTFEVASVSAADPRWGTPIGVGLSIRNPPGELEIRNASLKDCLTMAYGLKAYQLAGPPWIESGKYSITAKKPPGVTQAQLMKMLQNLLVERFVLTSHWESKLGQGLSLVAYKGGAKLRQATEPDESMSMSYGTKMIKARSITMPQFADVLSARLQLPVRDDTTIKGAFDIQLDWASDDEMAARAGESETGQSRSETIQSLLFLALKERLGLELKPQKVPVETLVIDSGQKVPKEN